MCVCCVHCWLGNGCYNLGFNAANEFKTEENCKRKKKAEE